jgi:hypothetical protein
MKEKRLVHQIKNKLIFIIEDDINVCQFVIAGLTRNPIYLWVLEKKLPSCN